PLRAMGGFSDILREDHAHALNDEARSYLDRIANASRRMGQLIDGLLSLSKITRQPLKVDSVDLGRLTRDVISTIPTAQRSVEWTIGERLVVRGDPGLLYSIVENLVRNAWKFTAKQPHAHIEVGRIERNGEPTYFVRDNGVGFDMAHSGQLFRPFRRLHGVD